MKNTKLIYDNLKALGYTDSFTQSLRQYLTDSGYTWPMNEALFYYLGDKGYTGQLTKRLNLWYEGGYIFAPSLTLTPSTFYELSTQGDDIGTFSISGASNPGSLSISDIVPTGSVQLNVDGVTLEYGATPVDKNIDFLVQFTMSFTDDNGTHNFDFILDVEAVGVPAGGTVDGIYDTTADETAPTLSLPIGTQTGSTTANGGVTTSEGNGTIWMVTTTSATAPTATQIKAGQDHTGAAAAFNDSLAVVSSGAKTFSITGLTASTAYYNHYMHEDAATNQSAVSTSASFTTTAATSSPPTFIGKTSPTPSFSTISIGWSAHEIDDVGLLFISCDVGITDDLSSLGWTDTGVVVESGSDDGTYRIQKVWWKRATSTSEPNVSIVDSGGINGATLYVIRGCRTTGAPVALLGQSFGTSATGYVVPTANTSGDNRFVLGFLTLAFDSTVAQMAGGYTNANLTDLTNRHTNQTEASSGLGQYGFDGTLATAGAVGNTTANIATDGIKTVATLFELIP